jgi:hypothetical protein
MAVRGQQITLPPSPIQEQSLLNAIAGGATGVQGVE